MINKKLFSSKGWKLSIFLLITLAIAFAIKESFNILNKHYNIYIISKNIKQDAIILLINILIVLIILTLILLHVHKVWIKVLAIIIAVCAIAVLHSDIYGFGSEDPKYYYFNSPYGANTLIVEEKSWLLGGWSNFYVKENSLFIRGINQSITTDDGYRPFSFGDYELSWIDNNTVRLSYGYGERNVKKTEIIKLK